MLNEALGTATFKDGVRGIETHGSAQGHALYGPYEERDAGQYCVDFTIVPLAPVPESDRVVAYVDVVSDLGKYVVSADYVLSSDLQSGQPTRLDFNLPRPMTVEYRVRSTGLIPLFIGDNPMVSLRGDRKLTHARLAIGGPEIAEIALANDERLEDWIQMAGPPAHERALGTQLRAMLSPLLPHAATGYYKERFGSSQDGGYVCVSDLGGIDTLLSFGINDNVDFDQDLVERGSITAYQFDHTVDDPRPHDSRMVFEKKMISLTSNDRCESLPELVRRYDKGDDRPNIFLKIDIENWEWPVFDNIDDHCLRRVRQITGEFHAFEFFSNSTWRERAQRTIGKLTKHFALVHVHGNNVASFTEIDGIMLPNVLEMTFLNRSCYDLKPSGEIFPTPLDRACDGSKPDYDLGAFRF